MNGYTSGSNSVVIIFSSPVCSVVPIVAKHRKGSPLHLLVIFNSKMNNFTSLAGNYDLTCLAVCFKPTGYMFSFLVVFKGPVVCCLT